MKTLANCTPREFLKQTNKIKNAAKEWLTKTDIQGIRRRLPKIDDGMSKEEKRKAFQNQAMDNAMEILDAVLDKHPDETIKIMCLVCFIEPEDADNHTMSEFLGCIADVLLDDNVASFFVSLASLGQRTTSDSAKE